MNPLYSWISTLLALACACTTTACTATAFPSPNAKDSEFGDDQALLDANPGDSGDISTLAGTYTLVAEIQTKGSGTTQPTKFYGLVTIDKQGQMKLQGCSIAFAKIENKTVGTVSVKIEPASLWASPPTSGRLVVVQPENPQDSLQSDSIEAGKIAPVSNESSQQADTAVDTLPPYVAMDRARSLSIAWPEYKDHSADYDFDNRNGVRLSVSSDGSGLQDVAGAFGIGDLKVSIQIQFKIHVSASRDNQGIIQLTGDPETSTMSAEAEIYGTYAYKPTGTLQDEVKSFVKKINSFKSIQLSFVSKTMPNLGAFGVPVASDSEAAWGAKIRANQGQARALCQQYRMVQ